LSELEPSDAQAPAHSTAHDHAHDHAHGGAHTPEGDEDDGEPQSTGFLPLSLAISLFVTGLFVLGIIPSSCG
jgi:hypothetical protein